MQLTIVVPYPGIETHAAVWAQEESVIDFFGDAPKAARCTLAFAAVELRSYLVRTVPELTVIFAAQRPATGMFIECILADAASQDANFTLTPCPHGVVITGGGRAGVLYGAYEFLRMQGWRWYAPSPTGEIAPPPTDFVRFPDAQISGHPAMSLGRGFDFEQISQESTTLLRWMACQRLDLSGSRPATASLGAKLGMSSKNGGHIFEEILDPDRVMPSGRTLWEEHPEWYGLPRDGVRCKAEALRTQFCASRPDLLAFLGEELLTRIRRDWPQAARLDVWGFDTWGSVCTCPACCALGNGADRALHVLSALRTFLNTAMEQGRLAHHVYLACCCYEGTDTIDPPRRPIPANLLAAGDYATFYPINRCYAHAIDDPHCAYNAHYWQALQGWLACNPALPIMIGEYYNVSRYEDLPLLFTRRIAEDLPAYHRLGVRGITYMHLPLVNWGLRTLNHMLYAELSWDVTVDVTQLTADYYRHWYGPYAEEMRDVYTQVELAWGYIASWRAWHADSVLSQLLRWDGAAPQQPLVVDDHFCTPAGAIASGRASLQRLQSALAQVEAMRRCERMTPYTENTEPSTAINPREVQRREQAACAVEVRIGEDRRLLRYGVDMLALMVEMVAYHDALYHGDAAVETYWQSIEAIADRLDSYYLPINYESPGAGLVSRDAFTRSQLRDVVRRCRAQRKTRARNALKRVI